MHLPSNWSLKDVSAFCGTNNTTKKYYYDKVEPLASRTLYFTKLYPVNLILLLSSPIWRILLCKEINLRWNIIIEWHSILSEKYSLKNFHLKSKVMDEAPNFLLSCANSI